MAGNRRRTADGMMAEAAHLIVTILGAVQVQEEVLAPNIEDSGEQSPDSSRDA